MDEIRKYLLSVIAATIISGMITGLLGKKGTYSSVVKLFFGHTEFYTSSMLVKFFGDSEFFQAFGIFNLGNLIS